MWGQECWVQGRWAGEGLEMTAVESSSLQGLLGVKTAFHSGGNSP